MKMRLLEWVSFNDLEVTFSIHYDKPEYYSKPKYRLEFRSENGDILFMFACTENELRELKQELDYIIGDK